MMRRSHSPTHRPPPATNGCQGAQNGITPPAATMGANPAAKAVLRACGTLAGPAILWPEPTDRMAGRPGYVQGAARC